MNRLSKIFVIIVIIICYAGLQLYTSKLKRDLTAYKTSCLTLLDTVQRYIVADSLKAIQIGELQLKVSEYKRYREEDAALIEKLKADKVTSVTTVESVARDTLLLELKDTVIRELYLDTVKQFSYHSRWNDIQGLIFSDSVRLNIQNKEELLIVQSIERKKFLFIKLPPSIFGYKSYKLDILSKNPNTTVVNAEWVNFK